VLGLRIGETLALRKSDVDFTTHIIRIRQTVDAATRKVCSVKSKVSRADLPMSKELEARLRTHLQRHDGKNDLLFVNGRSRRLSANKLRAKQLHPLLDNLGIERDEARCSQFPAGLRRNPAVVQLQLRHSDARITLGIYGHVIGNEQRDAVQSSVCAIPPAESSLTVCSNSKDSSEN